MGDYVKIENLGDLQKAIDFLEALGGNSDDLPNSTPIYTEAGNFLKMTVKIGFDKELFIEVSEDLGL